MSKRSVFTVLLACGLAVLGAPQARAQFALELKADIPFEFRAGEATMPAGPYMISPDRHVTRNVLLLNSRENDAAAFVLTITADTGQVQDQSRLVFHKYGDRYFLTQVWVSGERTGWQIPTGRSERELAERAARHEVVAVLAQR